MTTDRHDLWQQAMSLAARAHVGQLRKDGRTPYAAHPLRVAMTVRHVFGCDDARILAAAALHDVIEDTTIDYDDLEERFGPDVAQIVALVSKDPRLPEPERERAYHDQLRNGRWEAQLVKLADAFDNLTDAHESKSIRKVLVHARGALAVAGDHPALAEPKRVLASLIDRRTKECD